MTGGSICLLYICIVLDLAVGVMLCKSSMLESLGCPSAFYMYAIVLDLALGVVVCNGICAQLTGGSICLLYICIVLDPAVGVVVWKTFYIQMTWEDPCCMVLCFANVFGVVVFNSSYAWLTQGSICLLYICIVLDLALGVVVCMASVLNWLGRATWSVMVFNTYMLDWLGGPSAFYIYALSLI